MTETYWNGLPTPAERVRVVVDTSPVDTWWCADLAGTERAAVRVGRPGEVMYIDDENGRGWWKVTEGRGSPREAHWSLPVVREIPPPAAWPTREQIAEATYSVVRPAARFENLGSGGQSLYLDMADAVLDLLQNGAARG
jgi:hypothetical protein